MYICYEHSMYVSHIRIMGMVHCHYVHCWIKILGKDMKPLIHPSYRLNSSITVLLPGLLCN